MEEFRSFVNNKHRSRIVKPVDITIRTFKTYKLISPIHPIKKVLLSNNDNIEKDSSNAQNIFKVFGEFVNINLPTY